MYHVPVKVDNDANAAALAETRWGAARGYRYVFYATIGTGIGTGIVLDGRIYHGNTGSAGEGGHVSIDYRGPAVQLRQTRMHRNSGCGSGDWRTSPSEARCRISRSAILELAKGDVAAVTSELVGQAYAAGDPLAREILQETVEVLTPWLGNIVDLLDPDVLVMGGGVAAMLEPFFDEIKNRLPGWCVNPRASEIPLVMAHYGADAGIAGGAALCADGPVIRTQTSIAKPKGSECSVSQLSRRFASQRCIFLLSFGAPFFLGAQDLPQGSARCRSSLSRPQWARLPSRRSR